MKYPRILSTGLCLVALAHSASHAQFDREYAPWPVVEEGDTLSLPYWGGVNDPKPTLADFDGDGLYDLFVGEIRGKLSYLKNVGTNLAPDWEPVTQRLGDLDVGTWHALVDIDADGDLDLFGDSRNGLTSYWRNETVGSTFVFTLQDTAFGGFQTGQNNTSAFADIDADRDFDFFFGNLSGTLTLYRNIGDSASPNFVFETDVYDDIIAFPGGLAANEAGHGFSTIRFADIDSDLDFDLFYGDIFNTSMYFFINGGTPDSSALVLGTETYLPQATSGFNHATFADLDGDFDLDMVVGAANGQDLNNLLLLRNDGTPLSDSFTVADLNLLPNVDVGSFSVPAFGDLDGDGDLDLILGRGDGRLSHYLNTGSSNDPVFERTSEFYQGIDVGLSAAPELADWDVDGDLDLLLGTESGTVQFWRNVGSVFDFSLVLVTAQLGGFQVDRLAIPRVADLNNDGLEDLLVGEWDFNGFANVQIYQSLGPANNPQLSPQTFGALPREFRDFTLPYLVDWDKDGAMDMILGGRFLGLKLYRNASAPDSFPDSTTWVLQPDTIPGSDDGYRLAMATADIDSDTDLDVFVGEEDGGLNFYRQQGGATFTRGDVNDNGAITSSDVIYLVNYVFKAGPVPLPVEQAGDVNCNGAVSSADIIYLVNYVFKGGPAPCAQ